MTIDPRNQRPDQEWERDLESVRSKWDSLHHSEPPDLLDQAVLNRAKLELETRGRSYRKQPSLKWLGAFATAAVVVLALTLTIEQEQQSPLPAGGEADGIRLDRDKEFADQADAAEDTTVTRARLESPTRPALSKSAENYPLAEMKMAETAAPAKPAEAEVPDAEDWIEKLLALKASGQDARLAEELSAFRAAYPQYTLPPELEE